MGLRRWIGLGLFVGALAGMAVACSDDGKTGKANPNDRPVEVYTATIKAVAENSGLSPTDVQPKVTVYVAERDEVTINAEVQVGVVLALDDWATIRFIDDVNEAIDTSVPDQPVKGEGLLIGLGPISSGEATARVYADLYLSERETRVYDVSLIRRMGEWQLDAPLAPTKVNAAP